MRITCDSREELRCVLRLEHRIHELEPIEPAIKFVEIHRVIQQLERPDLPKLLSGCSCTTVVMIVAVNDSVGLVHRVVPEDPFQRYAKLSRQLLQLRGAEEPIVRSHRAVCAGVSQYILREECVKAIAESEGRDAIIIRPVDRLLRELLP